MLHVFDLDIRDVAEEINRLNEISWPDKRINKSSIITLLRSAENYDENDDNTSTTPSAKSKSDEWTMEDDMAAVYALENFDLALVDLRRYFHYDDCLLHVLQCGTDESDLSQIPNLLLSSTTDPTFSRNKLWKEVKKTEGAEDALRSHHDSPDGWKVTQVVGTVTRLAQLSFGNRGEGRIAAVPNNNNTERVLVHVGSHNSYETYRGRAHQGIIAAFNGSEERRRRNDLTLFEWLREADDVFDVSTRFAEQ
ncbi:unnamed protein product [Didymodactylos carnosus]|nr:unnamed protein product [Didymodactylos carnosus]CAF4070609.1 unnamed protein product [Didymodactylos carnosus]